MKENLLFELIKFKIHNEIQEIINELINGWRAQVAKKKVDAIVVLGGGIDLEGNLRGPSKCRISKAYELYNEGKADYLIVSSKWSMNLNQTPKSTIAEAMQRELKALGVSEENILLENISRDTIGNAYFTLKEILQPKNWKNIIVVTSHFHRERSEYLFRKILGPEYEIIFIESDDGLLEEDLIKQNILEKKQLSLSKQFLDGCEDGDIKAITNLLFTIHPAYAENPKVSITDFFGDMRSPFHEEENKIQILNENDNDNEKFEHMNEERYKRIFIVGPDGSGKCPFADAIIKKLKEIGEEWGKVRLNGEDIPSEKFEKLFFEQLDNKQVVVITHVGMMDVDSICQSLKSEFTICVDASDNVKKDRMKKNNQCPMEGGSGKYNYEDVATISFNSDKDDFENLAECAIKNYHDPDVKPKAQLKSDSTLSLSF